MATPTVTTDITTISTCESTTGWTGPTLALDPDIKKQGNNSISAIVRNDGQEIYYSVTNQDYSGQHMRFWVTTGVFGSMKTKANGGLRFYMDDGTNRAYWNVAGSDTYAGGWLNICVYADSTPDSGTVNTASVDEIGIEFGMIASFKRVINTWFDFLRYGDGLVATGGLITDTINIGGMYLDDLANGYGIIEWVNSVFFISGSIQIGNGATTTWFYDYNDIHVFSDVAIVSDTLYRFDYTGSACTVYGSNTIMKAPFGEEFDIDGADTNLALINWNGMVITDADNANFGPDHSIVSCVFTGVNSISFGLDTLVGLGTMRQCGLTTQGGSDMQIMVFEQPTGAVSLLVDDIDNLTRMTFGSDGSNHAMELDPVLAGGSYTLDQISYVGYASVDGSTGNEAIYNNSGGAITLYVVDGDTPSIRNGTGASTTVIVNPVDTTLTITDNTATPIEDARCLVWVTDNSNYFSGATVSITGTGTTATVSHTAHGMVTGDKVIIGGVTNDDTYNGQYTVTVTGVNAYTYTTNESINIGTASGTITSTFAIISGLSSALGVVSDTRSWGADQPIAGRVRKSTSSPYYVTSTFTGSINKDTGFITIIQLVSDE